LTQDGIVKGTIPYMSPEQASGKLSTLTASSDVYALGCLLYEMLTLHPAFKGGGMATLALVCAGDFKPVSERNARRPVPAALADLCTRAMSRRPEDRPGTAREFGEALRQWLDGRSESERRHEEAETLTARGRKAVEQYERLKDEVLAAEDAAHEQEANFKPWQPVSLKKPLLDARKLLADRRTDLALAFAEAVNLLTAALTQERENPAARGALAALWAGKLEDAERRGDSVETAYALQMMRRHDRGALAKVIEGNGTLTLTSDPEATVELYQLEEQEGILVPEAEPMTGETPVGPVPLPMGRYLAVLSAPGRREVRYPVHIRRNLRWMDHVLLPTDEEIGEEFVYVPSGPFLYGAGRNAMIRELHGFAIARYPVTFAEYAEFLQTLSEEEAERRLPQAPGDGPFMARGEDGVFRPLGNIVEGPAYDRCAAEFGEGFEARVPVMGVSIQDAIAYCRFKTETTGREWRLPTEEEWEKAARGVDGRVFPWGDCEDASLAKCGHSRDEPAQIEPIGTFPTATSIYGMGDAAGNVWEWTDSFYDETRALRVLRGGSWSGGADYLKSYLRFGSEARTRVPNAGFRCARSI
jgi:serine/threonine-protein kinase